MHVLMTAAATSTQRHLAACCACDWRYRDDDLGIVREAAVHHRANDAHPVVVRAVVACDLAA